MKVSVVIPCYNSEQTIGKAVALAKEQLRKLGYEYEFILVNDGSKDETFQRIAELCRADPAVKGIDFSRNFGQHSAIMAGLGQATGELVLGMDDDLQTHPSQFPKLFEKLDEGYDVVYGWYPHKHHNWFRNLGSSFERWTMRVLTGRPKWLHTSSFWVARAFVCREAVHYTGPYPHASGLFLRVTGNVANVELEHFDRATGQSGYTLKGLIRLWSTSTNFSVLPLRLSLLCGAGFGLAGVIGAIVVAVKKILHPQVLTGWSSLMVVILLAAGINLICLGLVGEYVGRMFMMANKQPQYVVRTQYNCESDKE
ncbi:glycosyltransferase family 2 protein [Allofournierella sp.]|uniref:glycosyltransferase family 2 protein n=1 Tax=Allofournierella sp. TaxID=1940256 RepID=UPI003AB71128